MDNDLQQQARRASWLLAAISLIVVLHFQLLPTLLAGLLAFELVQALGLRLRRHFSNQNMQLVAVALLATLVVAIIGVAVMAAIAFFKNNLDNLPQLLSRMAQIIEEARTKLPQWIVNYLPATTDEAQHMILDWVREHSAELRLLGKEAGINLARVLIGLFIGAMIATSEVRGNKMEGPLSSALVNRAQGLADAFRRIVFAQVRISAVNTIFSALYLMIVLPLAGVHLPLVKTMVTITFLVGLLPVVGNLISNTIIVTVSLAHSIHVAFASLGFLVLIHKLEYFLNARIVGTQIQARAWELLTAMLVMEAIFGIPGLVVAPIAYAWLKSELTAAGML